MFSSGRSFLQGHSIIAHMGTKVHQDNNGIPRWYPVQYTSQRLQEGRLIWAAIRCIRTNNSQNLPSCSAASHKEATLSLSLVRTPTLRHSSGDLWISPYLPDASPPGQLRNMKESSPLQECGSRAQLYLVGAVPPHTPIQALSMPVRWHSTPQEHFFCDTISSF